MAFNVVLTYLFFPLEIKQLTSHEFTPEPETLVLRGFFTTCTMCTLNGKAVNHYAVYPEVMKRKWKQTRLTESIHESFFK